MSVFRDPASAEGSGSEKDAVGEAPREKADSGDHLDLLKPLSLVTENQIYIVSLSVTGQNDLG